MKNKIKVFCPHVEAINAEVSQIFLPGLLNGTKHELAISSILGSRILNREFMDKYKDRGGWDSGEYGPTGEDVFSEKITWVPYEEEQIDVLLIHGSGNPKEFQEFANHYKHLPIINVDYKDVSNPPRNDRMYIEILGDYNVTNFKRSMTILENGKPVDVQKYPYPVHHTPFCVREDILEQCDKLSRPYNQRQYSVSCFFPSHNNNNYARGYIATVVEEFNKLKTHTGYTTSDCSSPQEHGRQGVGLDTPGTSQYKYVDTMANSKIIVTACPPAYEGDFRLMEAMTSGALVMHNRMLLPPSGLVDGKHWVVYDSPDDLRDKIIYYTKNTNKANQIAETGKKYVLNNHRPHHRVEEWLRIAGILS